MNNSNWIPTMAKAKTRIGWCFGLFILIAVSSGFSEAHKFYMSVTNFKYVEEEKAFQITSRIFIDDLDDVLAERYGMEMYLDTPDEKEISDKYIKKYFQTKFSVELNGEVVDCNFLGKRYENDVAICYLEVSDVDLKEIQKLSVTNEVLTDLFDEQQNIVHIKWGKSKKSFVLTKYNNKGMLNF
ncbi:MAG: DUF6702 family protein [Bacteroidota bacterium]